jgi:hypothetical protein
MAKSATRIDHVSKQSEFRTGGLIQRVRRCFTLPFGDDTNSAGVEAIGVASYGHKVKHSSIFANCDGNETFRESIGSMVIGRSPRAWSPRLYLFEWSCETSSGLSLYL